MARIDPALRAEWEQRLRDAYPDDARDTDVTEERWTHLDPVTFAQTVKRARRGIIQNVKVRTADGRISYRPETIRATDGMVADAIRHMVTDNEVVSVSYDSLGDITPPLTARMGEYLPGMRDVGHRPEWSRYGWRSNKGTPRVNVTCPCGARFVRSEGHPEPSGDYWRRCVRYFVNPDNGEQRRARRNASKRRYARGTGAVVLDPGSVTAALFRARAIEGLTFEERRALTD